MPDALHTRRETRELPLQLRYAPVSNVDAKARTIDVVWTTGAQVRRYDWRFDREYLEELSLEPGAIIMDRLNSGKAPFLDAHARWELRNVLGVVEGTRIESGEHLARVRFSKRAEVEPIFQDVQDKILQNVSVGYSIQRMEMIPPAKEGDDWVYRATSWTPQELSLVPIGADIGAGTRSEQDERAGGRPFFPAEFTSREEIHMPKPNTESGADAPANSGPVRAERERVREITARARSANLPQEFVDDLIERGLTLDQACRLIVDETAARAPASLTNATRTEPNDGGPSAIVSDFSEAILARYGGPKPSERAARYTSLRITDMAKAILEANGANTRNLSRDEIITRAFHSTSDFANLLENVGGKILRRAYEAAPPGVKVIASQKLARDFKPMSVVQFGEAPGLQQVLEGGEFKRGKMLDAKETYSVSTYGRIFGVSRQALVNDDLSAFNDMGRRFGQQAAEFERGEIAAIFTDNGTMNDGGALFNATAVTTAGGHANLGTGGGSALGSGSLSTAVKSLRLQKGLDGETPINVMPKYLIVPATLEYTALQLVALITPASSSNVNPYAGKLEVIVDARLDASSTTAWYLAADPAVIDGLEYAYLDDAQGPQLFTQEGWDRDGIEWKVRLDFGCAATEWRGLYKANGA